MITPGARERMRELARAEVARNAPPATGAQAALVTTLLGPETAAAAARRQAAGTAARGAA